MSERKTTLNDKTIDRLPFSEKGQYIVRDADLPGFFLVIGVRRKTFTVQAEFWKHGIRHTTRRALGTSAELTTRDARIMPKQVLVQIATGAFAEEDIAANLPKNLHDTFHQGLAKALREADFPRVGGKGGGTLDWAEHFRTNPGSREDAFDILRRVTRDFDQAHGTDISSKLPESPNVAGPGPLPPN